MFYLFIFFSSCTAFKDLGENIGRMNLLGIYSKTIKRLFFFVDLFNRLKAWRHTAALHRVIEACGLWILISLFWQISNPTGQSHSWLNEINLYKYACATLVSENVICHGCTSSLWSRKKTVGKRKSMDGWISQWSYTVFKLQVFIINSDILLRAKLFSMIVHDII